MGKVYAYRYAGAMYLNITNRCSNACWFCIRNSVDGLAGNELWLDKEPSADEVVEAVGDISDLSEVVFCGYGEPTYRPEIIVEVARKIKERFPGISVRINTNGHGNLINGRDILPDFQGVIDAISVSLNAENAEKYEAACSPCFDADKAYQALKDFVVEAKKYIPRVVVSVLTIPDADVEACRRVAYELGVDLRVRYY